MRISRVTQGAHPVPRDHLEGWDRVGGGGGGSGCFLFQKHFCLSPFIPTATLKKLEPSNFHLQRQEDFKSLAAGGSPSALLLPPQELADLPMLRVSWNLEHREGGC